MAAKDIGVRVWQDFSSQFDSDRIVQSRALLAGNILNEDTQESSYKSKGISIPKRQGRPYLISDNLMGFFEDLGIVYNQKVINKELTHQAFSYHLHRWWVIVKDDIELIQKENSTLFSEFKTMAEKFPNANFSITEAERKKFLNRETGVNIL